MIHEVINTLIDAVEEKFGAESDAATKVEECRYYKGEFEEGSQWNPVFPIVMINCSTVTPELTSQQGWLSVKATLGVYVGIKLDEENQQEFFAEFLRWITTLNIDGYDIEVQAGTLTGYFGGVEAYKFDATVVKQ